MKIKDTLQAVVFICFITFLPLFAIATFIFHETPLKDYAFLDKSFTTTINLFSVITSLIAACSSALTAIIAWLAFSQWKEPEIRKIRSQQANNLLILFEEYRLKLVLIQEKMSQERFKDENFSKEIDELVIVMKKIFSQDRLVNDLMKINNQKRSDLQNICIEYKKLIKDFNKKTIDQRQNDETFNNLIKSFDYKCKDHRENIINILMHKK